MTQTYGVRGLTCVRCLVSVIDEVRALPGVDGVRVDLVTFGESQLSVVPDGSVTPDQVRSSLDRAGFEWVGRRSRGPAHTTTATTPSDLPGQAGAQ